MRDRKVMAVQRASRRSSSVRTGLVIVSSLLATLVLPPPANATLTQTCTYDTATRTLQIAFSHEPSSVTISRNFSDEIVVTGIPSFGASNCANRTVFQVDKIVVTGTHTDHTVNLDLSRGPLAPGHASEPGTSEEIEIELDLTAANGDHNLTIAGSTSPNHYVFGSAGANLNASETTGKDSDLTVDVGNGTTVQTTVYGATGKDKLLAGGGSATGGPYSHQFLANAGADNDLLEGGVYPGTISPSIGDQLDGGRGRDTLTYQHAPAGVFVDLTENDVQETFGAGIDGVAGIENLTGSQFKDLLEATNSKNVVKGLGANDDLYGRGGPDKLNGGPKDDECIGGPGIDTFVACETVQQGGS